ncbi:lysozyme inhibitor LprI family protein [Sandarakinorhabdus rubra]|uniref:lysozyme inhibitor LprI family protein n=1 Tax=Sandarakinorhabdus rubra TaxID=2672568 RepID=UPI0013DA8150|nr:lysozyme inhibitor LprI family protein [Sandarakinorhabdus rubra]
MRKLVPLLVVAVSLTSPMGAIAQTGGASQKASKMFDDCMESVNFGAGKDIQWAACYADELARQDKTLNRVYGILRSRSDQAARARLVVGQRSWLTFRENWCRFEEVSDSAPGGEVNYQACMLEMTLEQINRLKASTSE